MTVTRQRDVTTGDRHMHYRNTNNPAKIALVPKVTIQSHNTVTTDQYAYRPQFDGSRSDEIANVTEVDNRVLLEPLPRVVAWKHVLKDVADVRPVLQLSFLYAGVQLGISRTLPFRRLVCRQLDNTALNIKLSFLQPVEERAQKPMRHYRCRLHR